MKLKFSALTPNDRIAIADQTPTPSRILGNILQTWEEVGLNSEIQEIAPLTNLTPYLNDTTQSKTADTNTSNSKSSSADNPFANSFKNALTHNLKIPELPPKILMTTSDSPLNTPSIFPMEANGGLMAIVNAALNTPDPDFHFEQNDKYLEINAVSISDSAPTSQSVNSIVDVVTTSSLVTSNTQSTTSGLKKGEPSKAKNENNGAHKPQKGQRFQAVPVIRTANTSLNSNNISISQTLPNIIISQPNNKNIMKTINTTKLRTVPIAQTTKTTAIIAPKIKDPALTIGSGNNSLYKVILKLPDGRSVQLPIIQQPITSTGSQPSFALKGNDLNSISTNNITIGSTISSQPKQTSSNISLSTLQSKVDATLAALPPKAKPGRKSKFAPEEDPREKKARSLERNRAAAMRCRLKRKHWIDSLEEKADEYEKINEKLQVFMLYFS